MRPVKARPRILNAHYLDHLKVSAIFNNGEQRIIDFKPIFIKIEIKKNPQARILIKPAFFQKFTIDNGTISWKNAAQEVPWGKQIRKVPFEIGADTLYEYSQPGEGPSYRKKISQMIRKERKAAQMTQGDLALRSGTTPGYISRVENNRTGIELDTLQKLVEVGLRKKLHVTFR
jgi:Helix-turn-helix/Protein of unknown function (DUF2442)